jgi:hypothetical protein
VPWSRCWSRCQPLRETGPPPPVPVGARPCQPVSVYRSFSRLGSPNSVGRPTFLHPPIQVRARPAKPFRSQAALRHPCPGGHATGPDFSTARRTVTS